MPNSGPFPNQISSMEPLIPQRDLEANKEIAAELIKKASGLGSSLNAQTGRSIKDLLRSMNSYYSNLIEGQSTHPYYIDQALKKNYEKDPQKKNLQMLAVAHIETQKKAENYLQSRPETNVTHGDFLRWLHREFYSMLPEAFLEIPFKETKIELIPGEFRTREVTVGTHFPPQAESLPRFLQRFDEAYSSDSMDTLMRIVAGAAAHQRLAWIHPFLDGNGRIVRLFSDSLFFKENLGGFGFWTISRGLARKKNECFRILSLADEERKNDYDGRGALSDQSLSRFCQFFLSTAIDQVEFMSTVLNFESFEKRLNRFMEILEDFFKIRKEAFFLLRDLYLRGRISRGEAARIMNLHERTASTVISTLIKHDIVKSDSPKSELYLHFSPLFAYFIFPNLYPESLDITAFMPSQR